MSEAVKQRKENAQKAGENPEEKLPLFLYCRFLRDHRIQQTENNKSTKTLATSLNLNNVN